MFYNIFDPQTFPAGSKYVWLGEPNIVIKNIIPAPRPASIKSKRKNKYWESSYVKLIFDSRYLEIIPGTEMTHSMIHCMPEIKKFWILRPEEKIAESQPKKKHEQ